MTSVFPVSHSRHLRKRWQSPPSYAFAARYSIVPLVAAELSVACASLPIGFVKEQEAFIPVAILSLTGGRNACVAPDGQWTGAYIPAAFRIYPFSAESVDGKVMLRVEEDSGLVTDGPEGKPFFNEDGTPGLALLQAQELVAKLERNRPATGAACAMLERHGVLQPWPISLATPTGERQFSGMYRIDEAALQALPGDALLELQQSGALALAYCQLFSQPHLARLGSVPTDGTLLGVRNPEPVSLAHPSVQAAGVSGAINEKVLLVSYQWGALSEMPYLLKRANCEVHVLCPAGNPAVMNGFYDFWIDAGATMDTLIAALKRLARAGGYRYILIGDDPLLWKIYGERITELWHLLPIRNEAALSILGKLGLAAHSRQYGISAPAYKQLDDRASANDAPRLLGWPVVVKDNYSNGGSGVKILRDQRSYDAYMDACDFREPLLAQQFIAGPLVSVEVLFKNGKLLQYACSEVLDDTLGATTKRRYFPKDPQVGAILRILGETTMLHGFVNVSTVRDEATGTYYLYEADPRPNKWVPYCHWFGSDFSEAFKLFLEEGESDQDPAGDMRAAEAVECWDIEFFPNHLIKLVEDGKTQEIVSHLLDFDRVLRYTLYDPVLLKAKMDEVAGIIGFDEDEGAPAGTLLH